MVTITGYFVCPPDRAAAPPAAWVTVPDQVPSMAVPRTAVRAAGGAALGVSVLGVSAAGGACSSTGARAGGDEGVGYSCALALAIGAITIAIEAAIHRDDLFTGTIPSVADRLAKSAMRLFGKP